ncbi:hypothetical protein [Bacillus wiedmannii]|uniref:Uncharacterized protein n=1 Tax=Bacillus wiedmannii TaxID=1890302 RepID=A0A1C4B4P1_9BACI|nr:hypothetical protein [Bacillus wiedmannii]SCC01806.1 Uncharacterized protein BC05F1_01115 [Bacillus wiedmannii]
MKTHMIKNLYVKGLDEEIKYDQAFLRVHKVVDNIHWNIDIDRVNQISIFRDAIRSGKQLEVIFDANYQKELDGTAKVVKIIDDSVVLKGLLGLEKYNS